MIRQQSAAKTCYYYCKYGAIREAAGSCTKVSQPHAVKSPLKRYSAPPNQTPPIEQASLTKAWLRKISTKKKKKSSTTKRERGKRTSVTPNDNWPPFRPEHISFPSFSVPHSPTDKKKGNLKKSIFIKPQACHSEEGLEVVVVEELVAFEVDAEEVSSRGIWARLRRF